MNNRKIIVSAINTAGLIETPYAETISGDNEIIIKTRYSHISSGTEAAQLAQLQGANLIATDISTARIAVAKTCGISNTVNNSTENLKDLIQEKTDGRMVSTLIDATGSVKLISEAIKLVGMNGEVILLGSIRAPFETNLTSFMQHFHYLPWCHTLKGALEFTYPTHPVEFAKHSIERNARIILEFILSGKLNVKPLLSHLILPSEIQAAYDGLRNKPDEYFGVVLDWTK